MTKRSFLSRITGADQPPDWGQRLAAADEAIAVAEREHGSAALAAELEAPGAAARLVAAVQALQAARTRKTDLTAARAAWEAQESSREAKVRAADAEKEDKAALAAFDAQAAFAREGEAVIAAYVRWWAKMMAAGDDCRARAAANPRVRRDLAQQNLEALVKKEISRVATTTPFPPGADLLNVTLSDKREWPSLGDTFGDLAASVCPDSAKLKGSRRPT